MPSAPTELTTEQLETLRERLIAKKAELLGRPRETPESLKRPEVGDAMDAADRASETEEAGARDHRDGARLADIEHALAKFAGGEYGVSEESGEPIGFGRLEAIPWARLTVSEEEALERARR